MEHTKKRGVGRPRKYETAGQLKQKIDEYFGICEDQKKSYTITGLARHLGLDRKGLIEYKGRPEYTTIIKEALWKLQEYIETKLIEGRNTIAMIFWLKNNADWADKTEQTRQDIPFEVEVKPRQKEIPKPLQTIQDILRNEEREQDQLRVLKE